MITLGHRAGSIALFRLGAFFVLCSLFSGLDALFPAWRPFLLALCPFRALGHLLKGTETAQEKTYRITEGV